ncbi:biliverdin-producing heme oxygenase [Sphingobacterium lactis]|uniref:biliverdin-producing heme oxygenase n=1 Tax=Sphingobacterium lactis TaxID=797291 RepID=UPI003F7D992C
MQTSLFLKSDTLKAHQATEKLVIKHIKEIDTDNKYGEFLKKFYVFHTKVEEATAEYLNTLIPQYQFDASSVDIKADLDILGIPTPEQMEFNFPSIDNYADALIAQYVLMGSSLGRPYIAKMIQDRGIEGPFNFLKSNTEESSNRWTKFKELLDEELGEKDKEQLKNKANEVFNAMGNLFA